MIELPWSMDDVYASASDENRVPVDVEKLGTPGTMRVSGSPMPKDWLLLSPHDADTPTWDVEEGDTILYSRAGRNDVLEAFRVVEVFDAGGLLVAPVKDGDG